MKAYVFPGQGSQFTGMGKALFDTQPVAKALFEQASELLGFDIARVMFEGDAEALRKTDITQPAIFIHSVATALVDPSFAPDMAAGHSLGELSALAACKALSFADGLTLVKKRAQAMQRACEMQPSTMAAVMGLDDIIVDQICRETQDLVVVANYNCPGQIIISGTVKGVEEACEKSRKANAKRTLILAVGGAFHSPLMQPAAEELNAAIDAASFSIPICSIYQNVDAAPHTNVETIKRNLKKQLTAPVQWQALVRRMAQNGAAAFIECGPGKVLQGLCKKIAPDIATSGIS